MNNTAEINNLNEITRYQRSLLLIIILLSAVTVVAVYFLVPDNHNWAYGVALGSLAGIIKFIMDVQSILSIMQEAAAGNASPRKTIIHNIKTFFIMGAVLALAFYKKEYFEVWGALGGLIIPRIVLMGDAYFRPALFAPNNESTTVTNTDCENPNKAETIKDAVESNKINTEEIEN